MLQKRETERGRYTTMNFFFALVSTTFFLFFVSEMLQMGHNIMTAASFFSKSYKCSLYSCNLTFLQTGSTYSKKFDLSRGNLLTTNYRSLRTGNVSQVRPNNVEEMDILIHFILRFICKCNLWIIKYISPLVCTVTISLSKL